jgi:hypothetical protein
MRVTPIILLFYATLFFLLLGCNTAKKQERQSVIENYIERISLLNDESVQWNGFIEAPNQENIITVNHSMVDSISQELEGLQRNLRRIERELTSHYENKYLKKKVFLEMMESVKTVSDTLAATMDRHRISTRLLVIQDMLEENKPVNINIVKDYISYINTHIEDFALLNEMTENLRLQPVAAKQKISYIDWLEETEFKTEYKDVVVPYKDSDPYSLTKRIEQPWSAIHRRAMKIHEKNPGWSKSDCVGIAEKGIWVGMDIFQLRASWGNPRSIGKTSSAFGTTEQWVYGLGKYVYVENLRVTGWQQY